MLEELKQQVPESVLAMMRVPGLGPKRAAMLFKELKVATLDELRAACEAHKVRELKGFGAKTEESILAGLQFAAEADKRVLWAEADDFVQEILAHMRGCPAVEQIEAAGSYRRGRDTVGDLDFLAVASDAAAVMDHLAAYPGLAEVQCPRRDEAHRAVAERPARRSPRRAGRVVRRGDAILHRLEGPQRRRPRAGQGPRPEDQRIRRLPRRRSRSPAAPRRTSTPRSICPAFRPRCARPAASSSGPPQASCPRLIELGDIRGDLHMHSTWTDGQATIEEMALAAKARGLKYIAMTDHSKRVTMVNGLDEARIRKQWEEIDRLNERLTGITVLKGVEVDILERGGLDLSDDVLKEADWVNASIHYGQNQSREQITRRVVDALQNPYVRAFAHPTGRMLNAAEALRDRSFRGDPRRPRARQGAGTERPSLAARPGRRGLCRGEGPRRAGRDFHRLAPARGPGRHALRHLAGPPRRLDQGRRAQHAHLGRR